MVGFGAIGTVASQFARSRAIDLLALLAVIMLGGLFLFLRTLFRAPTIIGTESVPQWSDARHRFRCVGPLRLVSNLRGLDSDTTEPRIFQLLGADPGKQGWATALVVLATALVVGVIVHASGLLPLLSTIDAWFRGATYGLVGVALVMFTWPTYYRLSPGRLDVLRYRFLGRGKPALLSYDLRTSRVLVDLNKGAIMIERRENDAFAPPEFLDIRGVLNKPALTRAIFESARSTHPTPPLPDDALIG